jgi:hypothetical protein
MIATLPGKYELGWFLVDRGLPSDLDITQPYTVELMIPWNRLVFPMDVRLAIYDHSQMVQVLVPKCGTAGDREFMVLYYGHVNNTVGGAMVDSAIVRRRVTAHLDTDVGEYSGVYAYLQMTYTPGTTDATIGVRLKILGAEGFFDATTSYSQVSIPASYAHRIMIRVQYAGDSQYKPSVGIDYCLLKYKKKLPDTTEAIDYPQYTSLIAVANGKLWRNDGDYWIEAATGNSGFDNSRALMAAELGQVLYIANYGAPKKYTPATDTVAAWAAVSGDMPDSFSMVVEYRGRLVIAGDPSYPHVWYMSKQNDPTDWNYGASVDDLSRAIAGTSTSAPSLGAPITALVPGLEDSLVFACSDSLWILRGDPAMGGEFDRVSSTVGIIDRFAWCRAPGGDLYFLARDGLYVLPAGFGTYPQPISETVVPREMRAVDPSKTLCLLAYDPYGRGINIFLSDLQGKISRHWWYDIQNRAYWPVELADDGMNPSCIGVPDTLLNPGSRVLLGGRDGVVRRFDENRWDDDGYPFPSWVKVGPVAIGPQSREGVVTRISASLPSTSDPIRWELQAGQTPEEAINSPYKAGGLFVAGLNRPERPRVRGAAAVLKMSGTSGHWSWESVDVEIEQAGKVRKR